MSTTDKATPRPWNLDPRGPLVSGGMWSYGVMAPSRDQIATAHGWESRDRAEADAALIVRAVNNHEALVAALEAAERFLTDPEAGFKDYLLAQIADALASARGEAQG